jgi:transcriptional repressor NrdR
VYRTFKDVQEFVETLEDIEMLDIADPNNPQMPLTPVNYSGKPEDEKTVPRTSPASPLSN